MSDINPQLALPSLADESGVLVPVAEGGAEGAAPSEAPTNEAVPEGLPGPGDETVYV